MKPPEELYLGIEYIRKTLHDEQIAQLIKDETVDDTAIRELALTVLSNEEVNGDTLGVPDIVTVVESLVKRIKVTEQEQADGKV